MNMDDALLVNMICKSSKCLVKVLQQMQVMAYILQVYMHLAAGDF